jgi:hypothetical protein
LSTGAPRPRVQPAPDRDELALAALAPAGAAALAASSAMGLDDSLAVGVSVLAAAGAAALPYLDRPHGHLEEAYPPSYAPKLLALAGASTAPAAAALAGDLASAALIQAGTALAVGALTTGRDYQMRVEAYRSLNLDWAGAMVAVAWGRMGGRWKWLSLAVLGAVWLAVRSRTPDLLGQLDQDLPAGHTHHLSAAQRLVGDATIALGPRPGRKWAGLGLAGLGAASLLRQMGYEELSTAAALGATMANAMMLAAFRRPERPLDLTVPEVGRSLAVGGTLGAGMEGLSHIRG